MAPVALYVLSLCGAAGSLGAFAQQTLGAQGFAPTLHSALFLAGCVALAFVAAQLSYVALIRLLMPHRSSGFFLCESLSQLTGLFLLPYVLHMQISWPHPALSKIEPLLYLAAFGGSHLFFKLVSFFTALRSESAPRWPALAWAVPMAINGILAAFLLSQWLSTVNGARTNVIAQTTPACADGVYAKAVELREGAVRHVTFDAAFPNQCLTLRWAHPPALQNQTPLKQIHVSVEMFGNEKRPFHATLTLQDSGWTELRVPPDRIADDLRFCRIRWTTEKEGPWEKLTGLRPVLDTNQSLLLSGPFQHAVRNGNKPLNYIVVCWDGLGIDRVSGLGYKLTTTPFLDELLTQGKTFTRAYTPAPEAPAACMTLLTGASPLRHGILGKNHGPLPPHVRTWAEELAKSRYATAAFMEAEDDPSFAFGTGFERGFDSYDAAYAPVPNSGNLAASNPENKPRTDFTDDAPLPLGGSADTIARAITWVEAHSDMHFFVFLRLRELTDLRLQERHGKQFIANPEKPTPRETSDTILSYLDQHLGRLFKRIRDSETRRNTCIIITSSYGISVFEEGRAGATSELFENVLNVPVVFQFPGSPREQKTTLMGLEDIMPTALALSDMAPSGWADGVNISQRSRVTGPISMQGDPIVLTIRDDAWRFYWASGASPESLSPPAASGDVRLFRAPRTRSGEWSGDVAPRNANIVNLYRTQLSSYLTRMDQARKDTPPPRDADATPPLSQ